MGDRRMSMNEAIDSIVFAATNDFEAKEGYFLLEKEAMTELAGLETGMDVLKALEARAAELGKVMNFTIEEVVKDLLPCYKITWTPTIVKTW